MNTYVENRPWGKFEKYCHNEKVTVKIITVNPNSELSLQYHNHRDEFWKIIAGSGEIFIGDKLIEVKIDDAFFIPKKTNHQILTSNEELRVLEISFGEFDEKDIVRLSDKYGRK